MSILRKVTIALTIEILFFAALLFGAAGTWRWPAAWAFLILFTLSSTVIIVMLDRRDPALLAERMKAYNQKGQPLWDRIFLIVLSFVWIGWLVLMGLDAVRYHWSTMPVWLQSRWGHRLCRVERRHVQGLQGKHLPRPSRQAAA